MAVPQHLPGQRARQQQPRLRQQHALRLAFQGKIPEQIAGRHAVLQFPGRPFHVCPGRAPGLSGAQIPKRQVHVDPYPRHRLCFASCRPGYSPRDSARRSAISPATRLTRWKGVMI